MTVFLCIRRFVLGPKKELKGAKSKIILMHFLLWLLNNRKKLLVKYEYKRLVSYVPIKATGKHFSKPQYDLIQPRPNFK